MIDVQSVSRHYGRIPAVQNVSFHVSDCEIIGLLGHNGAGKTTMMRMLAGYLEPCAGTIEVNGIDLASNPAAVQQTLGYLPENLPIYPDMLVVDYLDYVATLKGIAAPERLQALHHAILATELGSRALDPIRTLSRGLRQRVGVAQAVLGSPRMLILDEPTNGLDPQQTEHMRQLIKGLARNATVILSTHIMQEVDALCDRVLMLRAGELVLDERLESLHQSSALHLRAGGSEDRLSNALQQLPGIASVQQQGGNGQSIAFTLLLFDDISPDEIADTIARTVLESGGQLIELRPQRRSLESVFHEVNSDGA
ncbi:MAG: ABC-2 type transport system ATP-binding protein [Bacteroidia bacterium]|jgi:ABC-2 type transport system ATP-binding protein